MKKRKYHGQSKGKPTPEYNSWAGMLWRCRDESSPRYKDYKGRGITVCERWEDFVNFFNDMGERPSPKHLYSLDRIDNDLGYSPENCRWALSKTQMSNRRITVKLTLNGVTKTLVEWADEYDQPQSVVRARLQNGWELEAALTAPLGVRGNRNRMRDQYTYTYNGKSLTVTEWAAELGLTRTGLWYRLRTWGVDKALSTPKPKK